jgi:hypothetical protein
MKSRIFIFTTHHEKLHFVNFILFNILSKTNFDIIRHDVHVQTLMRASSSRFELMTSWKHNKALSNKPLQNFINKEERV